MFLCVERNEARLHGEACAEAQTQRTVPVVFHISTPIIRKNLHNSTTFVKKRIMLHASLTTKSQQMLMVWRHFPLLLSGAVMDSSFLCCFSAALLGIVTVTTVPPPSLGVMVRLPPHMSSSL